MTTKWGLLSYFGYVGIFDDKEEPFGLVGKWPTLVDITAQCTVHMYLREMQKFELASSLKEIKYCMDIREVIKKKL